MTGLFWSELLETVGESNGVLRSAEKKMMLCIITKHSSALYIGMAKVLSILDVLGYDGQNSSFSSSSPSDSTPI